MKRLVTAAALLAAALFASSAQTPSFKKGQWMEIQNDIMRSLTRYYVDSLPADRMYTAAINEMLSQLDPYTIFVPEASKEDFEMMISNSYGGIGAIIHKPGKESNVIINEPYEGSPAALAGLRCGDEIVAVDSVSVIGLTATQATSRMKGKPGTEVVLRVKKLHPGKTPVDTAGLCDVKITRKKIHLPDIEYCGLLSDGKTGYIYQSGFTQGVSDEMREDILKLKKQGMKSLVLDLRGNGGGLLDEAVKIVSLFVPKGTEVVRSKGSDGEKIYKTPADPVDEKLPLMVLVDSGSASASEIVSGALQDLDRAVIAGTRTFGKGLVQRVIPLAYNTQLKVTVSKYYTPSGRCVQARDYSHRNEDGSVGNIPDSLTHVFKTASGREVRDGGGITPDIKIEPRKYSRTSYAAVYSGITSNYTIEYAKTHETIPALDKFHLTDEDYAAFVEWAAEQKFDARSESETYLDLLKEEMEEDGEMDDDAKAAIEALEKIVKRDKKTALEKSKDILLPLIEEEIAVRYYYQSAGIKVRLRTDYALEEALKAWKR